MKGYMNFLIKPEFILNPNPKIVDSITKRLKITNGHCPCHNKYSGTDDDICSCKAYREEDHCCCTLYIQK